MQKNKSDLLFAFEPGEVVPYYNIYLPIKPIPMNKSFLPTLFRVRRRPVVYSLFLLTTAGLIAVGRSNGPAFMGLGGQSGAPGEGQCANCHAGGSFVPLTSIQVFENNTLTPALSYVPGTTYDVRVNVSSAVGNPHFGFQMTALNGANAMAGNFNTPGAFTQVVPSGGRIYIEHNAPAPVGLFTAKWVAPGTGTGNVTFYANGNCVNGTGNTLGDNAIGTTLSLPEFNVVLPVDISDFSAVLKNDDVVLAWTTSSEKQCASFVLEHSADGIHFSPIAVMASKAEGGNADMPLHYQALHAEPVAGSNFFRLIQIDLDGKQFNTGRVLEVQRSLAGPAVMLFPNPAQHELTVRTEGSGRLTAVLTDLFGRPLQKQVCTSVSGMQEVKLDLKALPAGNYMLMLLDGDRLHVAQKVQKN